MWAKHAGLGGRDYMTTPRQITTVTALAHWVDISRWTMDIMSPYLNFCLLILSIRTHWGRLKWEPSPV